MGRQLKLGVAYAHSKQAITVKQMKKVLMLPFYRLNFANCNWVSYEYAINLILGILLTAGCMGDIALYQKVSKFPDDALVQDHPSKPQFTVYES